MGLLTEFAVVAEPPTTDSCDHNVRHGASRGAEYSTLLIFTGPHDKQKIVGDLAKSWDVSKDGLTYTFKLRRGVKFHDGTDFTAEDIKATYERIRDLWRASSPPVRRSIRTSRRSRRPTPTRSSSSWAK